MSKNKAANLSPNEIPSFGPLTTKLKPDNKARQLGAIKKIDPLYDYAEVYLISDGKSVTIPIDPSLGLKKNDIVVVLLIDNYYHVSARAEINFLEEEHEIYDPFDMNEETAIEKKQLPDDFPIDYPKKYFLKKEEGTIAKYIKYSGYKISELFVGLFSKMSKVFIENETIISISTHIKNILYKNASYKGFKTTNSNNSIEYSIFYDDEDIPYYLTAKGNVAELSELIELELKNIDIDLNNICSLEISLKALTKNDINELDLPILIHHEYDMDNRETKYKNDQNYLMINIWEKESKKSSNYKITSKGNLKINAKILQDSDESKILKNNFLVFARLKDKEYDAEFDGLRVMYLKAITKNGEIYEFSVNKQNKYSPKTSIVSFENELVTNSYKLLWEDKLQEKHLPIGKESYRFESNYEGNLTKNFGQVTSFGYNLKAQFETKYLIDLEKIRSDKFSNDLEIKSKGFRCDSLYADFILNKKSYTKAIPIFSLKVSEISNKVTLSISTNNVFDLRGKIRGDKYMFSLINQSILFKGFKYILAEEFEYLNFKKAYMELDSLNLNNLSIKTTLNVKAKNIIFKTENFFIDTDVFQNVSKTSIIYASDAISLYVDDKNNKEYSVLNLTKNSGAFASSGDIYVQGYQRVY